LFGSYRADDEGVPAQRVQILTNGVLRALLMSRVPSKDIPHSNGHARSPGFGEPRAHIGNLIVSAKGGLSRAALLAKAAKLAKSAGDQVYVVRLLDEPTTLGPMGGDMSSMMRAMFGGRGGGPEPQRPLVAFQLTGGKETPVRGFTLGGLTPRSLKDIAAAGKEPVVLDFFDGFGGSMPSAIVTPSLLLTRVEVREQTDKDPKPPLYPHPYFAARTQSSSP
jgi:predicted Zn-dependent protease